MSADHPIFVVEAVEFSGTLYAGRVIVYPHEVRWAAFYNHSRPGEFWFDAPTGTIQRATWDEHRAEILTSLGESGWIPDRLVLRPLALAVYDAERVIASAMAKRGETAP